MSEFDSANAYWEFANTVRHKRRWIMDPKEERFLSSVRKTAAAKRSKEIEIGTRFFRAQRGISVESRDDGSELVHPMPEGRMIPDAKYIFEGGRANPPGFAYLYLANDAATALAEMRPWLDDSLTLALFKTTKAIRLVACEAHPETSLSRYSRKSHSPHEIEGYVWNDIGRAFAYPVNRDDSQSSYIPTQILAEAFKAEGFGGIAYHSGLGRGINIVLFDIKAARLIHRFVYTLKRVRYDFEAVTAYAICEQRHVKMKITSTS